MFDRRPSSIVIADPPYATPVDRIGVYSASGGCVAKDFPRLQPLSCPLLRDDHIRFNDFDVYYSSASLNLVRSARVFYDEEQLYCIGILFEYNDGSQQTVGQCKLGLSAEKRVVFPSMLYHRSGVLPNNSGVGGPIRPAVLVEFLREPEEDLDWTEWTANKMSGVITFWFTYNSTVLIIDECSG